MILKTKLKNRTDWEREENPEAFGKISDIDMAIKWPFVNVKSITSPPKGRTRKNMNRISSDSSETGSPDHKKMRTKDDDQDEETQRKIADFTSKLERQSKYSQSKLIFTKNIYCISTNKPTTIIQ